MNILYGVAGVGYGHSSRALVIAGYLESKGHKVRILTYGDAYKVLKDKFDCVKVSGLDLVFKKGVVDKKATVKENIKTVTKNLFRWRTYRRMRKGFDPDVCISDMEPIVPIMSYWGNLPLVCIDNQHRLTNLKVNVPKEYYRDYVIAREMTKAFIRRADRFIVSSFGKSAIRKKDTVVVPPIVRKEVQDLKPKYGDKILVYLSKSDKKSLKVLRKLNEKFVVYGFNQKKKSGNIEFKTRETFLKDLENCKAVIGTSGFSLMGEAIYLNKPYLAIPLKGQFEQVLNSLILKDSGFGDYAEKLTEKDVVYFLHKAEEYKKKLKKYNPDQKKLFREIDKVLKEFGK